MSRVPFLNVIDRTFEGQYLAQEDFDMTVFATELAAVVDKFGIRYQAGVVIPDDDDLVQRVFQAGVELYTRVGTYCVDTERVIRFSGEEIEAALQAADPVVEFGEGKDSRCLRQRGPDSAAPPFCFLGAGGISVSSDEIYLNLIQAYAECRLTDSLTIPSLIQVNGRSVRPNSPLEVMAAMRSTRLMAEALRRAGRPGIPIMNAIACASSDTAKIAGSFYLRPSDGWMIGSTAELKVETPRFNEIAFVREQGGRIVAETTPLLGGYCGGPEGVAVASVAYHLHANLVLQGDCQLHAPLHINHVCATDTRLLWALSLGAQAITQHSKMPLLISPFMAAGPLTEMCFLETAAAVTAIVVSGSHLEALITHGGATTDLLGPLTTQFAAEVAHAVAGMTRRDADPIVRRLNDAYQARLGSAPQGKFYQQAYDLKTGQPLAESLEMYQRMQGVIRDHGIPL